MWRAILGILGGLLAWIVVVTLINFALRQWLPGYHQAEPTMAFTLTMKLARLGMAAVTSIVAGAVVRAIAPSSRLAPWITGLVLLALFLPEHIMIWARFPVWYHLGFLVPLAPLVAAGAMLTAKRGRAASVSPAT